MPHITISNSQLDNIHIILILIILILLLYILKNRRNEKLINRVELTNNNPKISNLEMIKTFKVHNTNLLTLYKPFQLSSFLHSITNRIAPSLKLYHHQLYYDIDTDISRYIISDNNYLDKIIGSMIKQISQLNQFSQIIVKIQKNKNKMIFTVNDPHLILNKKEIRILKQAKEDKKSSIFKANLFAEALSSKIAFNSNKKYGTKFVLTIPYIEDKNEKRNIKMIQKKLFSKKILFISDNTIEKKIIHSMFKSCSVGVENMRLENFIEHKPHFNLYDIIILKSKNLTSTHIKFFKNHNNKNLTIIILHDIFETPSQKELSNQIANITLYHPLIIGDLEEKFYQYFILQSHKKEKENHLYSIKLKEFIIHKKSNLTKKELTKFKGNHIAVVENSLIDQKIMKHILAIQGISVYFCFNGEELINLLKTKKIDLIFTNIHMPILDGITATKEIKKILDYSDIPIIALDSSYFEHEIIEMMKLKMNGYIEKPITSQICYTALNKFLKIKKSPLVYTEENTSQTESLLKKFYIQNTSILNINKGIEESINEEFYKELLINTMDALKESLSQLNSYYSQKKISQMQTFLLNILSLYQNIYTPSIITTIQEMLYLITYHRESEIGQYIELYKKNWKSLENEVNNYLYSVSLK